MGQSILIREIDIVDVKRGDKTTVQLLSRGKIYTLTFKYALETVFFYEGITAAKKTQKEINRSSYKLLKYNIEVFYSLFNMQNYKAITGLTDNLCQGIMGDLPLEKYLQGLKKVVPEVGFVVDAFYCRKPFITKVFKQIVAALHSNVRIAFETNWNQGFESIGAGESLMIAESMSQYSEVVKKWLIKDAYFGDWERPVYQTFLHYLFENSKELFCNMLNDLKKSTYLQNGKVLSRSIDNLESHLNFVVDHYKKAPSLIFLRELAEYCGNLISNFLMNVLLFLRTEDMDLDVYFVIMNSNFIKIIKGVQKKISDLTKGQLTIAQIKYIMNDDFIFYVLRRAYKIGGEKIKEKVGRTVVAKLLSEKYILDLKFLPLLNSLIKDYSAEAAKLVNTNIAQDMFDALFEKIAEGYILLYLQNPDKISFENYDEIITKIDHNYKRVQEACTTELVVDPEQSLRTFKCLAEFAMSKDIDVIIISILNLRAYFPALDNEVQLRTLVKTKIKLPRDTQEFILNYFLTPQPKIKNVMLKYKKGLTLRQSFIVSILMIAFLTKLSWLI